VRGRDERGLAGFVLGGFVERCRVSERASVRNVAVRTVAVDRAGRPVLHRTLTLTPYGMETLLEDGMHAGRAAQLQVAVPSKTPASALARIESVIARLRAAGVKVSVLREHRGDHLSDDEALAGHAFARSARFLSVARNPLHQLQKERLLVAFLAASGGGGWAEERLGVQARDTDRTAAQLRAFVAAHGRDLPEPALRHTAQLDHLLGTIDAVRSGAASGSRSAEDAIAYYSRIDTELLAAVAAVVRAETEPTFAHQTATHFALLHAKEEIGLEGAQLVCAFATGSLAPRRDLTVAARIAAQQSYLTVFTAAAPGTVVSAYEERAADPAFQEVARLERMALEQPTGRDTGIDAAACLRSMTAKLERLREVGDVHSAEILGRAAHDER
jgi:hypothetical protein